MPARPMSQMTFAEIWATSSRRERITLAAAIAFGVVVMGTLWYMDRSPVRTPRQGAPPTPTTRVGPAPGQYPAPRASAGQQPPQAQGPILTMPDGTQMTIGSEEDVLRSAARLPGAIENAEQQRMLAEMQEIAADGLRALRGLVEGPVNAMFQVTEIWKRSDDVVMCKVFVTICPAYVGEAYWFPCTTCIADAYAGWVWLATSQTTGRVFVCTAPGSARPAG